MSTGLSCFDDMEDQAISTIIRLFFAEDITAGVVVNCGNGWAVLPPAVPLVLFVGSALAGRTGIPVVAGAGRRPLVRQLVTATYAHGENGLGGAFFPEPKIKPIALSAAEFIRDTT